MNRTHVIDVYRPAVTQDAKNRQRRTWSRVLTGLGMTIQAKSAALRAMDAGVERTGRWKGFAPAETDLEEGDGILVTDGPGPARLEVTFAESMGAGWDVEADLRRSGEDFGA